MENFIFVLWIMVEVLAAKKPDTTAAASELLLFVFW